MEKWLLLTDGDRSGRRFKRLDKPGGMKTEKLKNRVDRFMRN